ncbi:MAG: molybdenum cofactor biosynthesis protein MoaE [Burkholderiales bacterium]|nr:molybdenum cofactor biosynthesis protein MoaE [Burkholderiales bacterium]
MEARVQQEDFDLGIEVAKIRGRFSGIGAIASFVGFVRDFSEGRKVSGMMLEHYPGMAEIALHAILDEAREKWGILDATIVHRVGRLAVSEQIVLVLAASPHRMEAFKAVEFIIDLLKTQAPFWKKETTTEGDQWVEAKSSDGLAASRWVE